MTDRVAGEPAFRAEPDTASRDMVSPEAVTLKLLAQRAADATVCPSDVARVIAAVADDADWRGAMPAVHAAVDRMAADGLVRLSWKGVAMQTRDGPYRIGRAKAARNGRSRSSG